MPNLTGASATHRILSKQRNLLVENTTTETDLWTYSVPANTLGTLNALHVRIIGSFLNNSGSSVTFTLKWIYGTTVLFNDAYSLIGSNSVSKPFDFDVVLAANNATNSQVFGGHMLLGVSTPVPTVGFGDIGTDEQSGLAPITGVTATEDSTIANTFKLTLTPSLANVNAEMLITHSHVELIQ